MNNTGYNCFNNMFKQPCSWEAIGYKSHPAPTIVWTTSNDSFNFHKQRLQCQRCLSKTRIQKFVGEWLIIIYPWKLNITTQIGGFNPFKRYARHRGSSSLFYGWKWINISKHPADYQSAYPANIWYSSFWLSPLTMEKIT